MFSTTESPCDMFCKADAIQAMKTMLRPTTSLCSYHTWASSLKLSSMALVIGEFVNKSEVGGENGAKRRPPPGIQAQRTSHTHTTRHDTSRHDRSMASARWVKCQLGWTGASGASLRGISGGVVPSQSSNRTLYRGPYEAKCQDQAEYIILEVRVRRRVHGVDDFYVHLEQQKQCFHENC